MLIEHGAAGRTVVRLKGGDPFVFGRGGEEAEALRAAGIAFEVVPGITAGVAASAYAGIPVTHRDAASAVAFVTGHEDPDKPESALDWPALAAFPGTLVVYMGVRQLGDRAAADRRRAPRVRARGGDRARHARRAARGHRDAGDDRRGGPRSGIRAPAISLFGPVAALRRNLAWFERARWPGSRSRSPGPAPRPADWPRACASSAPARWRRRRSGSLRCTALRRNSSDTTPVAGSVQSDWTEFHQPNMMRWNAVENVLGVKNVRNLKVKWSYNVGTTPTSSPTEANGKVYAGAQDGTVYALNANNGAVLWRYVTGAEVDSAPAVVNGVVYVGSYDYNMYALNAGTGSKLWSYATQYNILDSPFVQ